MLSLKLLRKNRVTALWILEEGEGDRNGRGEEEGKGVKGDDSAKVMLQKLVHGSACSMAGSGSRSIKIIITSKHLA